MLLGIDFTATFQGFFFDYKTFRIVDPKGAKLTGVSNSVYTMSVNADRTQLLASSEAVANTVVDTIKDAANNDRCA